MEGNWWTFDSTFAMADAFLSNTSNVEIRFIGSEKSIESHLYKKREKEKSCLLKSLVWTDL